MASVPPPPPGFTLDSSSPPPPPAGFTLDKTEDKSTGKSQIDAALPTVPSSYSKDANAMQEMGKDEPGYEYGDILPFKKETATGKTSFAMPEAIRSPLRGMGDLISQAQNKSTESSPDALAAMMTMGGGYKPTGNAIAKTAEAVGGTAKSAVKAGANAIAPAPNAYIIKTLQKSGHTPEEIVDIAKRAKEHGMTLGEASNNPDLLGLERKISGLNHTGGEVVRDFVKNRVDPKNNVSIPFKLKSIADPLTKEVDRASKEIGATVTSAPKTPLNMNRVLTSLASEKRPPGSAVTNTLNRIDGLAEWAKTQGNSFEAWHRVKQEIWDLKAEASNPSAVEKLDNKTVKDYYKKVNDILSGRTPGLPKDLADTGAKYARANSKFHQNLSGRTITEVLNKMPEGGTPSSSLKYLYKKLAGNKELQEELFEGMPESQRAGMMKFLEAIKDSGRSGPSDVVKSMQQGSPSFPLTTSQVIHKAYDKVIDFIRRKDYDGLGKALTSPEVEQIAQKLGYVKPEPPPKPILRLTYQPKDAEIIGDSKGVNKIATAEEQAANDAIRDRMEKLGYGPGVLRAQDLNVIRAMEAKYGQSELGKFMIEHKNEPIMGRAWEVPQTEYNQATVDKMLGRDAMSLLKKLDKETQDSLNAELRTIWDAHKTTLGEMALDSRQAIKELSAAKGESITVKFGHNNFGDKLLDAVSGGTPLENVVKQTQ